MKNRIIGFDYLRIICAIGVVAIHSLDTNLITRAFAANNLKFVVPIFLMMSFHLLFNSSKVEHESVLSGLYKRLQRLLPQFAIWTIIYLLIRCASGSKVDLSIGALLKYFMLGDASMQLYYIPMLLYLTMVLLPIVKILKTGQKKLAIILFIALSLLSVLTTYLYSIQTIPLGGILFPYYCIYNLPFALIGICLAYFINYQNQSRKKRNLLRELFCLSIFLVVFFSSPFLLAKNYEQLSFFARMTSLEIILFLTFYYVQLKENPMIVYLSQLSFGIYLCHPIFTEGLQKMETKLGLDLSQFNLTIGNFLLGCLLSIAFSSVLYKFKSTRFIIT